MQIHKYMNGFFYIKTSQKLEFSFSVIFFRSYNHNLNIIREYYHEFSDYRR
jgi:hypothetical protein